MIRLVFQDEEGGARREIEARLIELQPGDKVLLKVERLLTLSDMVAIRDLWQRMFPDITMALIDGADVIIQRAIVEVP